MFRLLSEIDECVQGTHDCDENADCADTDGSYSCTCADGFQGNGMTCSPIRKFSHNSNIGLASDAAALNAVTCIDHTEGKKPTYNFVLGFRLSSGLGSFCHPCRLHTVYFASLSLFGAA